jgi:hypothetical protein
LIDDRLAIVSTANFENYPLTQGGETGILLALPQEVQRIGRHFTRLWHERCDWELAPGEKHTVAQRQTEPSPCRIIQPPEESSPAAIWTDGSEHHVLRHLHRVIESAQKELLLATWDAKDIAQDPELLIRPLERAVKRGVNIRMLARKRNPSQSTRESMKILANMGIKIFGDRTNHAKGAIADGQQGVMFSANFDFHHGLTSGIEMGVVLDKTKALVDFHQYLNFAINRANDIFVPQPTHRELNERLFVGAKVPWPLEDVLTVDADPRCWQLFSGVVSQEPVLFSIEETGSLLIFAGKEVFSLKSTEAESCKLTVRKTMGDGGSSSEKLAAFFKKKSASENGIGFCAASFELDR